MLSLLQYWISLRVKKILILRTVSDNDCFFNFIWKWNFYGFCANMSQNNAALGSIFRSLTRSGLITVRSPAKKQDVCSDSNWRAHSVIFINQHEPQSLWLRVLVQCAETLCSRLTMLHDTESVRGLTALYKWLPGGQPQVPWIVKNTEKMKSVFKHFLRQG